MEAAYEQASLGSLGRVGYDKWLRFTLPLLIILLIVYAIVLSVGAFVPGTAF